LSCLSQQYVELPRVALQNSHTCCIWYFFFTGQSNFNLYSFCSGHIF